MRTSHTAWPVARAADPRGLAIRACRRMPHEATCARAARANNAPSAISLGPPWPSGILPDATGQDSHSPFGRFAWVASNGSISGHSARGTRAAVKVVAGDVARERTVIAMNAKRLLALVALLGAALFIVAPAEAAPRTAEFARTGHAVERGAPPIHRAIDPGLIPIRRFHFPARHHARPLIRRPLPRPVWRGRAR